MKTHTIWESSRRPLFIRSVWSTSSEEDGRHLQRHFILDYESEEEKKRQRLDQQQFQSEVRLQRKRSKQLPQQLVTQVDTHKRQKHFIRPSKGKIQYSSSCDSIELSSPNDIYNYSEENLLLIDSAKIKLSQQQPTQQQNNRQQPKYQKFYRKPSFTKKKMEVSKNLFEDYELNNQGLRELQEFYSRHSSMHDLPSQLSTSYSGSNCVNPEERLAERVLNWLDLAGKSGDLLKNYDLDINEIMPTALQQQQQIEQQLSEQRKNSRRGSVQDRCGNASKMQTSSNQRSQRNANQSNGKNQDPQLNAQRRNSDAVKPITIIFNREGLPIRFNRPPRNIDLCALTSSASTTRRLAGVLASARLYHGNQVSYNTMNLGYGPPRQNRCPKEHPASLEDLNRMLNTEQKSPVRNSVTRSSAGKRFHEEATNIVNDSKRQLHIFMPSLPKKSLGGSSCGGGCGDDSSVSVLSHAFTDACKL